MTYCVDCRGQELILGEKTRICGILNVTPDSFSDGGRFIEPGKALEHALAMVEDGADIIDIGGQSTRPGSDAVSEEEEIRRVLPVVNLLAKRLNVPISIDTSKPGVARAALDAGAHIINDVTSLRGSPELGKIVAQYNAPLVLMHMKGTPQNMQDNPQYKDVISEIISFLKDAIRKAVEEFGISEENIIVDPGIGFGKQTAHNLEIINRLSAFHCLGRPLLLGPSRKSVIGDVLGLPVEERIEGTSAVVAYSVLSGVHIMRVHDVRQMVRVVRMTEAIINA